VCKHILAARAVAYDDGDELPRLYRLTAETLRIAPNEATEDAFRRIFGGCTSIVESLGTIRNRMGDAHGRGADAVRVEPRYARLAVNLSGAMATFLVETWEAQPSWDHRRSPNSRQRAQQRIQPSRWRARSKVSRLLDARASSAFDCSTAYAGQMSNGAVQPFAACRDQNVGINGGFDSLYSLQVVL
jgi:hypothetical protein